MKDWLAQWAVYSPDKTAIIDHDSGRRLAYGPLNAAATHLAAWLLGQGLQKGDRIMLLAEHGIDNVVLFGAAQKTGLVLVPVNYRLAPPEIDYLVGNCTPKLLLYHNQFEAQVHALKAADNLRAIPYSWLSQQVEQWAQTTTPAPALPHTDIANDDPLFILYTSGTTGFPKGALYTHNMLQWNSLNTTISLDLTSADKTICCTPCFLTGGWNVLLTPLLHRGGQVVMMKKFDADMVLTLLEQHRHQLFFAVPTMLKMMQESPRFANADLSSIRYFVVGGEALPLPVIDIWAQKCIPIRQGYGMTEVGPNLCSLHQDDAHRKPGSIGRTNFYVQARILDAQGHDVPQGQIGEFCFAGPMVTPGYWNNPEATEKAKQNGWFRTGDLVRQDDEGYLYVVDRIKNMFISGGENVYPNEVERLLLQHPHISEAAVTGIPHSKWGEVGRAFVVWQGPQPLDAQQLQTWCRQHMARFKVPHEFVGMPALPKTESGKTDRKALAQHNP